MSSPFRSLFSLPLVAGGVALVGVAVWLFIAASFIYTDGYHTQRQMYAPNDLPTWRDTLNYFLGLLLWSIPAIVVGLPGLILAVFGSRRFAATKSQPDFLHHTTRTQQEQ